MSKQGGDNFAIALIMVLGSNPPAKVTINEMTTVASASIDPAGDVWVSDNWQDEWSCYGKPDEGCFDPLWRPWDCRVQWHDL